MNAPYNQIEFENRLHTVLQSKNLAQGMMEKLKENEDILTRIAVISASLSELNNIGRLLPEILAMISVSYGIERSFILENAPQTNHEGIRCNLKYEYVKTGYDSLIDKSTFHDLELKSEFASIYDNLTQKRHAWCGVSDKYNCKCGFLKKSGAKSILLKPVFAGETFWGVLGFESIEKERIWREIEISTLSIVARAIGNAIFTETTVNELDKGLSILNIFLDNLPTPIIVEDSQLKIIYYNAQARAFLKGEEKEVTGKYLLNALPEEMTKHLADQYEIVKITRRTYEINEIPFTSSAGRLHTFNQKKIPIINSEDKVQYYLNVFYDITDLKKYQETLRYESELLKQLIDSIPDLISLKDSKGFYIIANRAFLEFAGFANLDSLLNKTDYDVYPPRIADSYMKRDKEIIESGKPIRFTESVDYFYDTKIVFDTIKTPFFDAIGETAGLITVNRDITELKKAEQSTIEANERQKGLISELTAANDAKNEILGIVAHDLRNPLTGILSINEILKIHSNKISREEIEKYLLDIDSLGSQMLNIINELLLINKIDNNCVETNKDKIDIVYFIVDILNLYRIQLNKKRIGVEFIKPDRKIFVNANESSVQSIINNLISNSIKFSPVGKNIRIVITTPDKSKNEKIEVAIKNYGQSLTESDRKNLFSKFSKLSARPTGGESSLGLGLYIVKKLVNAMNCDIWCESGENDGCEFKFTLPIIVE